jgi:hypothetical protein
VTTARRSGVGFPAGGAATFAVTPTIDRHYGVMGTLGERFVLYRLVVEDPKAQAKRRLANRGREGEMRAG